ncbi:hypothetical protein TcWFU_004482 [Taenia crassiceps]|uniref:Protein S-acyltransferase n=1 Tax=Taenia crassiceps TaxID=6207 RepID=A0ABR4QKA3_9CEST
MFTFEPPTAFGIVWAGISSLCEVIILAFLLHLIAFHAYLFYRGWSTYEYAMQRRQKIHERDQESRIRIQRPKLRAGFHTARVHPATTTCQVEMLNPLGATRTPPTTG